MARARRPGHYRFRPTGRGSPTGCPIKNANDQRDTRRSCNHDQQSGNEEQRKRIVRRSEACEGVGVGSWDVVNGGLGAAPDDGPGGRTALGNWSTRISQLTP